MALKRTKMARKPLNRTKTGKVSTAPKKKRVKALSVSKLKKQLEALQKQVVLKLYGNDCYTCEAKDLQGSNCHLGHVPWPRTDLSIQAKFDYRYTRAQCFRDNIHLGGAGAKAYARMQAEGIDMIMLREYADEGKGKPVPRSWYESKMAEYKALLEE